MLKRITAVVIAAFLLVGAGYRLGDSNDNDYHNPTNTTPAIFTGNQAMNPDDLAAVGRCPE